MPESCFRIDVLVIGGAHEDLYRQELAVRVERVGRDLTNLQPPEKDWCAGVQRAQICSLQHKETTGKCAGDHRLGFECNEVVRMLARAPDFETDVGARDQGA